MQWHCYTAFLVLYKMDTNQVCQNVFKASLSVGLSLEWNSKVLPLHTWQEYLLVLLYKDGLKWMCYYCYSFMNLERDWCLYSAVLISLTAQNCPFNINKIGISKYKVLMFIFLYVASSYWHLEIWRKALKYVSFTAKFIHTVYVCCLWRSGNYPQSVGNISMCLSRAFDFCQTWWHIEHS